MKPEITVYIVNHNYHEYLNQSIKSVLDQTFKNFELIIIDNGSDKKSKKILDNYSDNPKIFTLLQTNKGLATANNIAIRMARGKYIIRLDADDYFDKNALQSMYHLMESNKDLCLVFPDYFKVNKKGEILELFRRHDFKKVKLFDQPAHGACTMIRLNFLKQIGGYNEKFDRQDGYDMWLRAFGKKRLENINLPLFYYRQHSKNLTSNNSKLLETRSKIIEERSKAINKNKNTLCLIPIRGQRMDPNSIDMKKLGKKTVIEWTIDEIIKSKKIMDIVVTTPDLNLIKFLKKKYKKKIILLKRKNNLARVNSYLEETILNSCKEYKKLKNKKIDQIALISVDTPFKKKHHLDSAINLMNIFKVDMIISVKTEIENFYQHNGQGLQPLRKNYALKLESDEMYKEISAIKIIDYTWFKKNKRIDLKSKISHIVLDKESSITINDEFDWKLASLMVNQTNEF